MQPVMIQCPYCFEMLTIWLAYDDIGAMYYDCTVCCRPWFLQISLNDGGELQVSVQSSGG